MQRSDFETDLERLSDGIMTEIGERGTTLSGGQQQRLSIARALYSDPDLVVLDDPLAAVDSMVCNRIFKRGILARVARGKTVVMALNQLQLLPHFDQIICLENGTVVYSGGYADLPSFDWLRGGGKDANKGQKMVADGSGAAAESNARDGAAVIKAAEAAAAAADGIGTEGRDDTPVLIKDEEQKTGRVSLATVKHYIAAMGNLFFYGTGFLIFL